MNVEQYIQQYQIGDSSLAEVFEGAKQLTKNPLFLNVLDRGYAVENILAERSILFIGMNPSYNPEVEKVNPGKNSSYPYTHPYFGRIKKITEKVNEILGTDYQFAHHDLFYVRNTSQKEVLVMRKELSGFFRAQLSLTKKIIAAVHPRIIVVANAGACEIFQKDMYPWEPGSPEQWGNHQELGVDMIKIDGIKERIPVLFTGMISGQRALDEGSYKTLIWHICHILRNI